MGTKYDPLLGKLRTTDSSNPSIGGAVTSATSGSVLYINSSGQLAQDNANFFWDATNHRLGIGTTGPSSALEIGGSGQITIPAGAVGTPSIRFSGSTNTGIYSSSGGIMDFAAAGSQMLRISANGFFALGNYQISAGKTFGWGSGVAGTGGNDTGISRGAAGAVYIGTGAQGGFTGTLIAGKVGIGTTTPQTTLDINGGMRTLASSKSAAYQLLVTDSTVYVTTGATVGMAVTLPAASANTIGLYFFVYKVDAGLGSVAITPTGTDTINGVNATKLIANQWNGALVRGLTATSWLATSFTGL